MSLRNTKKLRGFKEKVQNRKIRTIFGKKDEKLLISVLKSIKMCRHGGGRSKKVPGKFGDVIYGQYQWQSKSHGHACRLEKMFPGKYGHSERSTGADFHDLFEVPFGFENLWHQTHLQLWLVQLYFNVNK